jgi:hypothetical protein
MRKIGILGLSLLATIFIQCENESTPDCNVSAVVRDLTGLDGCGFVFELENGTRLEPRITPYSGIGPKEPLHDFMLYDGQAVSIAYEETQSPSICMVGPVVKITCITAVGTISEE